MKLTNKLNLPLPFYEFENSNNHPITPHKYSVTELLNPTRVILLTRKYYNDIERDVSNCVPALLGTAVHSVLEKHSTPDMLTEVSVSKKIGDDVLSGRIDLLDIENKTIIDYKTTSCSKVLKQDFEDWRLQGLMYAWLVFQSSGEIIRNLKFYALLKDWSKMKSSPSSPIYVYEYKIEDSDYDFIEKFIKDKLNEINSGILPLCSDEEKWSGGKKYAVYKNSTDKKATKIFDLEDDAHAYITEKLGGKGIIDIRENDGLRCQYYCDVCKFCKEEIND